VRSDDLRQRFEALESEVLPLTGPPAAEAIRRRGRRRQRTIRAAVLPSVVLLGAIAARGAARLGAAPDVQPVRPPPPTRPAVVTSTTTAPATTTRPATTATTAAASRPTATVVPRADGLGVAAFGTAERVALRALEARLGPPQERGSWRGSTPFGTCPGPGGALGPAVRAVHQRPHPLRPDGRWHLFAWQVDQVQDPQDSGPTPPPDPPPLRGYSPGPPPASATAPPSPSCAPSTAAACASPSASPA
jgi:hypothetical protein